MSIVIVIPAYQPTTHLIALVNALRNQSHDDIVIIDDGSDAHYQPIFNELAQLFNITILTHPRNLGKGQALKTAFEWLAQSPRHHAIAGVVSADADGQHLPEDILNVAQTLRTNPDALVLGVRTFAGNIPWKSRLGNALTPILFKLIFRKCLTDTQTGLRGIPRHLLKPFCQLPYQRYEYEFAMLIQSTRLNIRLMEIPISTIYRDGNRHSHFNKILDSYKIYRLFFKYTGFSLLCGLLDYGLFCGFYAFIPNVMVAESAARCLSGLTHFFGNKHQVFQSNGPTHLEFGRYVLLLITNLLISYQLIQLMIKWGMSPFFSKGLALLSLYILNYWLTKTMVFAVRHRQPA